MYKVNVSKGGITWTIYRRYDQFFEFDKKVIIGSTKTI
jgi:hypothetical protein